MSKLLENGVVNRWYENNVKNVLKYPKMSFIY